MPSLRGGPCSALKDADRFRPVRTDPAERATIYEVR